MLIKIELLIISVIILKPKPSLIWLGKGPNVAAGRHCYFGSEEEGLPGPGVFVPIILYF